MFTQPNIYVFSHMWNLDFLREINVKGTVWGKERIGVSGSGNKKRDDRDSGTAHYIHIAVQS